MVEEESENDFIEDYDDEDEMFDSSEDYKAVQIVS